MWFSVFFSAPPKDLYLGAFGTWNQEMSAKELLDQRKVDKCHCLIIPKSWLLGQISPQNHRTGNLSSWDNCSKTSLLIARGLVEKVVLANNSYLYYTSLSYFISILYHISISIYIYIIFNIYPIQFPPINWLRWWSLTTKMDHFPWNVPQKTRFIPIKSPFLLVNPHETTIITGYIPMKSAFLMVHLLHFVGKLWSTPNKIQL